MTRLPLFLAALLSVVAATPATPSSSAVAATPSEIFIEVGPGMPTLEDLGLTPAMLYNLTMGDHHHHAAGGIHARTHDVNFNFPAPSYCHPSASPYQGGIPVCNFPNSGSYRGAGRNHVLACAEYLKSWATASCQVDPGNALLCRSWGLAEPDAYVWGSSIHGGSVASYCEHVSCAVYWAGYWCQVADESSAHGIITHGLGVAYGNGDYFIETCGP